MKRIILISVCCAVALACASGCGSRKAARQAAQQERADSLAAAEQAQKEEKAMITLATLPDEPLFDIETSLGTIRVKLYSKTPKHRENFAKLALSGYYDGLLFHRIISGFMIQGGDPLTRDPQLVDRYGTGGPDYTVTAEIIPEYHHAKGALAAARRGDAANPMKASSGSQFYIVQDESGCSHLDGEYSIFGQTVSGLDVIDKIASVPTNYRGLPDEPVKIISIKYVEE